MVPSEQSGPTRRRTVGILIFDDVEVLDFCGPFEVFFSARLEGQTDEDPRLFDVVTIAEEKRLVRCSGDLLVQPQHALDDHPPLDILVVPGGDGTRRDLHNRRLLDGIVGCDRRTEITMSVCTGALLLAEAGILDGLQATTHWYRVDWMRDRYPAGVAGDRGIGGRAAEAGGDPHLPVRDPGGDGAGPGATYVPAIDQQMLALTLLEKCPVVPSCAKMTRPPV